MRVLILGATGMLGHKLYQRFKDRFDTYGTIRGSFHPLQRYGFYDEDHILTGVDAFHMGSITRALAQVRPDVVINCIGIIKQSHLAQDPATSITLNALFPHQLAAQCALAGAHGIFISTDCVFNGRKGSYTENDPSDAEDLYGRTKFLGEVDQEGMLTLRTSVIGRELSTQYSLTEWFLSNRGGRVRGFTQAIYTGFPTVTLASILADIIGNHPDLNGVYQVASNPIDKHRLLQLVRDAYGVNIDIEPDDRIKIDRSLDGSRFREATGIVPPSWPEMVAAMAADPTPYDSWRTS